MIARTAYRQWPRPDAYRRSLGPRRGGSRRL